MTKESEELREQCKKDAALYEAMSADCEHLESELLKRLEALRKTCAEELERVTLQQNEDLQQLVLERAALDEALRKALDNDEARRVRERAAQLNVRTATPIRRARAAGPLLSSAPCPGSTAVVVVWRSNTDTCTAPPLHPRRCWQR